MGKWSVEERVGEGGNGVVWECIDRSGKKGALKVLKSYLLESTKDESESIHRNRRVRRFLDEITFLQNHQHPNVIPLLDSFAPGTPTKDNAPWLVMPLGVSLSKQLQSQTLSFHQVVKLFRDLAVALEWMHDNDHAHRDIKPDNVILLDGVPHFSDFGLVHFEGKEAVTDSLERLGPLFYVAPEMMDNAAEVDACPADVYSFAKSLWVAATGQKYPLQGEQRLTVPGLRISTYVVDPRAQLLDQLIDQCTRHNPEERPTATDVHSELNAWCKEDASPSDALNNIAELGKGMASVLATIADEKNIRKHLIESGKDLIGRGNQFLNPLKDTLLQGFPGVEISSSSSDSITKDGARSFCSSQGAVLWEDIVVIRVRIDVTPSSTAPVVLWSGIKVAIMRSHSLVLHAFHGCSIKSEREVIWEERREMQAGGAQGVETFDDLMSTLIGESQKATEVFTKGIEDTVTWVKEQSR